MTGKGFIDRSMQRPTGSRMAEHDPRRTCQAHRHHESLAVGEWPGQYLGLQYPDWVALAAPSSAVLLCVGVRGCTAGRRSNTSSLSVFRAVVPYTNDSRRLDTIVTITGKTCRGWLAVSTE